MTRERRPPIPRTPMAAVSTTRRSAAAPRQEPALPVAEPDATREDAARPATAYRTFSAKLAPALQATAGALLVAGGLGLHLRATRVAARGLAPEEVLLRWGYASGAGRVIALAGVLAVATAVAWPAHRRPLWKAAPVAAAVAGIVLSAMRLRAVDAEAARLVASTEPSPEFISFHAGFGWGAWFLLLGATALALAVLAGSLRELDLRREARS
ncbi:MAG: hypothetical protein WD770_08615 [Actinomycetota bacterium]